MNERSNNKRWVRNPKSATVLERDQHTESARRPITFLWSFPNPSSRMLSWMQYFVVLSFYYDTCGRCSCEAARQDLSGWTRYVTGRLYNKFSAGIEDDERVKIRFWEEEWRHICLGDLIDVLSAERAQLQVLWYIIPIPTTKRQRHHSLVHGGSKSNQ
jgi:hypothetical protein